MVGKGLELVETELLTLSRKQLSKLGPIVKVVTTLFVRYAKKLVQAMHSPPESDGTIGKSII